MWSLPLCYYTTIYLLSMDMGGFFPGWALLCDAACLIYTGLRCVCVCVCMAL